MICFISAAEIVASAMVEQELSPLIASSVIASSYPAPVTVISTLGEASGSRSSPVSVAVTSMDLSSTPGNVVSSFAELLPSNFSGPVQAESSSVPYAAFPSHQSTMSSRLGTMTSQVVPLLPAATSGNIGPASSFQQQHLMHLNSLSVASSASTPLLFSDLPSLSNSTVPPLPLPSFTSPFPNIFQTTPSQPPSATLTPLLQIQDNPAASMPDTWAASLSSTVGDDQRTLSSQNTAQNSMISQLLDSFMSDQPFSAGASTSSMFPSATAIDPVTHTAG